MSRNKIIGSSIGAILILTGIVIGAGPIYTIFSRTNTDNTAIQQWEHSSSDKNSKNTSASACAPSSAPVSDYMEVTFPSLAQYDYSLVAGNGTWSLLDDRSAVHWYQSPAPGGQGNLIVAFHREPEFQYISDLNVGQTILVEDRECNIYTYTITGKWVLPPDQVTQLSGTDGFDLTMITCTPWWQDYDRIVWRADLTGINGKPFTPPTSSGGTASGGSSSQPVFS